jgi:hypothetical protein
MADQPDFAMREDDHKPSTPSQSDLGERAGAGVLSADALRHAHLDEESYVKALAIANLAYFLFFGVIATYYARVLFYHLRGRINAPWVVQPYFLPIQIIIYALPIFALSAAWGFFRRKRWALRLEFLVAVCLFLSWATDPLARRYPLTILGRIGQTVMVLAIAAPMFNVPELRGSVIFGAEYDRAVRATPSIRAWPKLTLKLTLIAVVFFVVFLILFGLSMA